MHVCYCDKCGKVIEGPWCTIDFEVPIDAGFSTLYHGTPYNYPSKKHFELCGACASDVWESIMRGGKQNESV